MILSQHLQKNWGERIDKGGAPIDASFPTEREENHDQTIEASRIC